MLEAKTKNIRKKSTKKFCRFKNSLYLCIAKTEDGVLNKTRTIKTNSECYLKWFFIHNISILG